MITQDDAERAVDWLRENAAKIAKARAERLYMEQWLKSLKATLQLENPTASSVAASEILALGSPRYQDALTAYKVAIEADEHLRWLVTAAEARIEFWRSAEATRRAEGKATA